MIRRAFALVLVLGSWSFAQETREAPTPATTTATTTNPWAHHVQTLARKIIHPDTKSIDEGLLSGNATIATMHGGSSQNPTTLDVLSATRGATLIGAHAYIYPPMVVAADIAADAKLSQLPQEIKDKLIPASDNQMKSANATATQWITEMLEPLQGDLVGVIVLWRVSSTIAGLAPSANSSGGELIFVLVKAEPSADGKYLVRNLVFGNPVPNLTASVN